jgi:hypothetical protein
LFVGALIAGMFGPISGELAPIVIASGAFVLLVGTVPFAVVGLYARVRPRTPLVVLLAAAIIQISLGGLASGNAVAMAIAGIAAVIFGVGWALLGFGLLTDSTD